jgi:2-keto-4-pentenoate hydratase/2-oxohepta-3-ene-1,7-dioic acid hydratase in catechol pathway
LTSERTNFTSPFYVWQFESRLQLEKKENMRIVRFEAFGNIKYGMVERDVIHGFKDSPFKDFRGVGSTFPLDGSTCELNQVKLLAPCNPSKYVGIGLNLRKTAERANRPIPKTPILFMKHNIRYWPNDNIVLPHASPRLSTKASLLVIGKEAKDVRRIGRGNTCWALPARMMCRIFFPRRNSGNPTRTKGRDTFGPLGPDQRPRLIRRSKDEVYVNGELRRPVPPVTLSLE